MTWPREVQPKGRGPYRAFIVIFSRNCDFDFLFAVFFIFLIFSCIFFQFCHKVSYYVPGTYSLYQVCVSYLLSYVSIFLRILAWFCVRFSMSSMFLRHFCPLAFTPARFVVGCPRPLKSLF